MRVVTVNLQLLLVVACTLGEFVCHIIAMLFVIFVAIVLLTAEIISFHFNGGIGEMANFLLVDLQQIGSNFINGY